MTMYKKIKITERQLKNIVLSNLITEEDSNENNIPYKRVLSVGRVGEDVRKLQQRLKDLGYGNLLGTSGPNRDGVDGKYGDNTRKAVKEFQKKQGFPGKKRYEGGDDQWDGRAGKLTIEKLNGVGGTPKKDDTEKETTISDYINKQVEKLKNKLEQQNKEYLEKSKLTKSPFTNKEQGDRFRRWLNNNKPKIAYKHKLDPPGKDTSYKNSYILNALNQVLTYKSGVRIRVFDLYKKKNPDWNEVPVGGGIGISDNINPLFKDQIDFEKLDPYGTENNICKPNDKHCAQFVRDFSTEIEEMGGSAWHAYNLDTKLGPTIYDKFKGLDKTTINDIIELYQRLHEKGGGTERKSGGEVENIKNLVDSLVPKGKSLNLKLDDVVGIFYPDSPHHEEAFYQGGKNWFTDKDGKKVPGNSLNKGDAWGMNTHVGIVGAIKDGVPLVFHNVNKNVKSDPTSNLRIGWVKRKT